MGRITSPQRGLLKILMSSQFEIDESVALYANACAELWKQIKDNPSALPSGSIGCGSIAEHDAKKYLERVHKGAVISFGASNQKGWDIKVVTKNGECIKYQVKSVSVFNKSRRTTKLVRGFDRLIVLSLGDLFVPDQAFLFKDVSAIWGASTTRCLTLTVPNPRWCRHEMIKICHNEDFVTTIQFYDPISIAKA